MLRIAVAPGVRLSNMMYAHYLTAAALPELCRGRGRPCYLKEGHHLREIETAFRSELRLLLSLQLVADERRLRRPQDAIVVRC